MIKNKIDNFIIAFNNAICATETIQVDREKLSKRFDEYTKEIEKVQQKFDFKTLNRQLVDNKTDYEMYQRKLRYNYMRVITDAIYYANGETCWKYTEEIFRKLLSTYHIKVDTYGEHYNTVYLDLICATTESSGHTYCRTDGTVVFEDIGESFYITAPNNIDIDMFIKELENYVNILNTQKDANEYQEYLRLKEKYEK